MRARASGVTRLWRLSGLDYRANGDPAFLRHSLPRGRRSAVGRVAARFSATLRSTRQCGLY